MISNGGSSSATAGSFIASEDLVARAGFRPDSTAMPAFSTARRVLPSSRRLSPDIYPSGGLWDDSRPRPGREATMHPIPPTQPMQPTPKILLAEDDNDMRRFLVKALENAGFEVTDYDNGLAASRRVRGGAVHPRRSPRALPAKAG